MSKDRNQEVVWLTPVDLDNPSNNVWVVITKGQADKNTTVQSIRVFSQRPHPAIVEYQQQQFAASHHSVETDYFEVAVDFFDVGETDSSC